MIKLDPPLSLIRAQIFSTDFQIEDEMRVFNPPETDYERVCELMEARMNEGLAAETNPKAKVKMLPTYVRALPDGSGKTLINYRSIDLTQKAAIFWRWILVVLTSGCW